IQNDAIDADVIFLEPVHGSKVGRMQLGIVRQLPLSDVARIKRLTGFLIGRPVTLQKLAASVSQRDQDRSALIAIERGDWTNQIGRTQAVEIAVPQVAGPSPIVEQFVDRDHTKRTDGGKRAHFRAAKLDRLVPQEDAFAVTSARKIESL